MNAAVAYNLGMIVLQRASGLSSDEVANILGSQGFNHLVEQAKSARASYQASTDGAQVHSVSLVEVLTPMRKDENGVGYLGYQCAVCGTKARIRQLKGARKKTKVETTQMQLPNVAAKEAP